MNIVLRFLTYITFTYSQYMQINGKINMQTLLKLQSDIILFQIMTFEKHVPCIVLYHLKQTNKQKQAQNI